MSDIEFAMQENSHSSSIALTIATDIQAAPSQVQVAISLLDDGATVPFIARYRKEATGGLDDAQLRTLQTRLAYLRDLEQRRQTILTSVTQLGKLTDSLAAQIKAAETKAQLEDLYLPYKPKRRTRAQIAREAGLAPLADMLVADPNLHPGSAAASFVNEADNVTDVDAALEGARAILIETWAEQAALVGELRQWLASVGVFRSRVIQAKESVQTKYSDYFDYHESVATIPSHRLLALLRARREGVISLDIDPGEDAAQGHAEAAAKVAWHAGVEDRQRPADAWLMESCRLTWRTKLHVHLMLDLVNQTRERAEAEAITVFGKNVQDILLAAPAGPRIVLGLDPGIRTGCKVAVIDRTGKLLATTTIYPHEPKRQWAQSLLTLRQLCLTHQVELIAIGNGTASRETDQLASELIRSTPEQTMEKVLVNEAGASVYSASALASREFPDLDVSLRGAVSIARRLQDPMAELVKIEPKAIGVGQYQHDVDQIRLAHALDARVEDCVNAVGVFVNTASAALLAKVSGLSLSVAENIVHYREANGPFKRREQLRQVPRLGEKTFEQCAGFLRIADGDTPLDASAVHPEAYPVVERIVQSTGKPIQSLIGDARFLRRLDPEQWTDAHFGLPTVRDILAELEKPGRDPRPTFQAARFSEEVHTIDDVHPGMVLEGVVSNVAAFGAFVDIGVHHDGLIHISALADTFVKDPRDIVKAGDILTVKVLEVDRARQRIALTRRLHDPLNAVKPDSNEDKVTRPRPKIQGVQGRQRGQAQRSPSAPNTALAHAFARARRSPSQPS